MKALYSAITFCLLSIINEKAGAQCTANIQTTSDGKGNYSFTAIHVIDTSQSVQYHWYLNDTIPIDSNTLTTSFSFRTNGNYNICFVESDTAAMGCILDTCINLKVLDAEYHALLDSINIWNLYFQFCADAPGNIGSRGYCDLSNDNYIYTADDTMINGLSYKELIGYSSNSFYNYDSCLWGFIREDTVNRKIYFIDYSNNQPEILLYNFAMKIGDTFSLNSNTIYRLDSIMQVPISAGYRRVFFLNAIGTDSYNPLVWVESVGNLQTPVYYYSTYYGCGVINCGVVDSVTRLVQYHMRFLTCYSHQRIVYFNGCAYNDAIQLYNQYPTNVTITDSCQYSTAFGGGVRNIGLLSDFAIQPNPSAGHITLRMNIGSSSVFDILVWDMTGRQVVSTYALGNLSNGTHDQQMDLSALQNGIYLIECRSPQGSLYRKLVIEQ